MSSLCVQNLDVTRYPPCWSLCTMPFAVQVCLHWNENMIQTFHLCLLWSCAAFTSYGNTHRADFSGWNATFKCRSEIVNMCHMIYYVTVVCYSHTIHIWAIIYILDSITLADEKWSLCAENLPLKTIITFIVFLSLLWSPSNHDYPSDIPFGRLKVFDKNIITTLGHFSNTHIH